MDITTQAVAETSPIHLKGADGAYLYSNGDLEKPVRIIIYSPGTAQFAAMDYRQTQRAIKRMEDNDGKVAAAPPEKRRSEAAEDLAAITVRFENLSYPPAGDATGADLFQAVYNDPKLGFIVQQLIKAVKDWGNFKPGSAGV